MMASAQIQKYELKSEIDSLTRVEQIIEDLRNEYSIPEELYGNILVSLTEATNNAIRHGNKLDITKKVDFEFENSDTEFIFTVKDKGNGFDEKDIPDPTHPDNIDKPDGRGIFIMKNLADKVEFLDDGRIAKIHFYR